MAKQMMIIYIIWILIIVVGSLIYPVLYINSVDTTTIEVVDKGTKYNNGDEKYLIYSENEVYQVTDSILLLHFRVSDVYNNVKIDKVCNVKTYGWRLPFFSMYKNIVEVKC